MKNFFIILVIGLACSLFPWLHISLALGFPAVLLNSIILAIIYKKTHKKTYAVVYTENYSDDDRYEFVSLSEEKCRNYLLNNYPKRNLLGHCDEHGQARIVSYYLR